MKQNMFFIFINVIGIVVGSFAAIMAAEDHNFGRLLLMVTTVTINIMMTITLILKAIRAIVREELENVKTKQES